VNTKDKRDGGGAPSRAFVRGYAVAVAAMVRRQVTAKDLLRQIGATEALLREADVDDFDLEQLLPLLTGAQE
jgi:hypothetical protein